MRLSDHDLMHVRRLREEGVLCDDDADKLDTHNGVITVACADGDQMPEIGRAHV